MLELVWQRPSWFGNTRAGLAPRGPVSANLLYKTVCCLTRTCTSANAFPFLEGERRRFITHAGKGEGEADNVV